MWMKWSTFPDHLQHFTNSARFFSKPASVCLFSSFLSSFSFWCTYLDHVITVTADLLLRSGCAFIGRHKHRHRQRLHCAHLLPTTHIHQSDCSSSFFSPLCRTHGTKIGHRRPYQCSLHIVLHLLICSFLFLLLRKSLSSQDCMLEDDYGFNIFVLLSCLPSFKFTQFSFMWIPLNIFTELYMMYVRKMAHLALLSHQIYIMHNNNWKLLLLEMASADTLGTIISPNCSLTTLHPPSASSCASWPSCRAVRHASKPSSSIRHILCCAILDTNWKRWILSTAQVKADEAVEPSNDFLMLKHATTVNLVAVPIRMVHTTPQLTATIICADVWHKNGQRLHISCTFN